LELYRSKLAGIMRGCTKKKENTGALNHNCDAQSVICHTNEVCVTQDTSL